MDELPFYASPGRMTSLGPHAAGFAGIADPADAAEVVQGLVLHHAWAERYGVEVTPDRAGERQTRSAIDMLDAIAGIDDRPLTEPRPPERRLLGNCRHFATLTCALLRNAGSPARARCGFGTYFEPGKHIDHWIVERPVGGTWVRSDPQIDGFQRDVLGLSDPMHLDEGRFLDACEAWLACRAGTVDPDTFGILGMWGQWFVRGNVLRDLAALNKVELLPWDAWGLGLDGDAPEASIDEIADVVGSGSLDEIRSLYSDDPRLRVGDTITSFTDDGAVEVSLSR